MNILTLNKSETTPLIDFNPFSGKLLIEGISIPENAEEFFNPILEWLDEYVEQSQKKTTFNIKLQYFNVSSSKQLLFIFYKLNELVSKNRLVNIEWFYSNDEDGMYEVGHDFAFMINIPFRFIEYNPFSEPVEN